PVQVEVVLVLVLPEQLAGARADLTAHRDEVECNDVHLAGVDTAEEVGDAEAAVARLPREGESNPLRLAVVAVDDEVVALRLRVEVPVRGCRLQYPLRDRSREKISEDRLCVLVQECFVLLGGLALLPLQLPLPAVERDLVQVLGD